MSSFDPETNDLTNPSYELPDAERPASASPTEAELEQEAISRAVPVHDPYAALRHRDYCFYSIGWIASIMGQQIQSVAIGWELFKRTGSALSLGYVGLVQAVPVILLALPAGHLADRFDRRRMVMMNMMLSALCSLGLALLSYHQGSIPMIYVLLFLGGVANALGGPSRSALLPQVVPMQAFNNAVTWNSSFFQVASVIGPALGGFVVHFSAPMAYALDATCAVTFLVFLAMLRTRPQAHSNEPATFSSLMAGLRFVFQTKIILATITLDLFAVLLGGATYLLPQYATEILHVGSLGFGWLRAAPAIGAFVMAILLAHLPPMKRAGRAMLWAVAGFGASMIVFGLSHSFWLSFAMLFFSGVFDNISVVVRHTLVQVLTPDVMRGRVSAVNNVFIGASNELGGLESGITSWWLGPVRSVVFGGIGTILVVASVFGAWPQVRRFGSLQDAKPAST